MKEKIQNTEKQPKLILLNGSHGVGKSTISQRYVDDHPMALNLDIDKIWFMIGHWQQERLRSHEQKMKLSYALAETHLNEGYDVVVAQHLGEAGYYSRFEEIAIRSGSTLVEILLDCPLDEAIYRCVERGKNSGYKTGFRPGGILDTEGGVEKLKRMHNEMTAAVSSRANLKRINSVYGDLDRTYELLLQEL